MASVVHTWSFGRGWSVQPRVVQPPSLSSPRGRPAGLCRSPGRIRSSMTTTTLADAIVDCLRRGDITALASLYAPDALVDLNVPQWRWQLAGAEVRRALDGEIL